MKEEVLVKKICNWLKNQGFYPETEVTLGKRNRKIRVDIYVDRNPQPPLAIEVKAQKGGLFDGIGKALFYTAYTDCEVWLALPHRMCKLASHLNPLNLPFKLFDTSNLKLMESNPRLRPSYKIYICPLCGEKVGDVNRKMWLKLHLLRRHGTTMQELFEAIRIYKMIKYDKKLKRTIDYAISHSEEYDYTEGNEYEWEEEDGFKG